MVTGSALTRKSATAGHILIEPEPLSRNRDLASQPHAAEPDDMSVFSPAQALAARRVGCLSQEYLPVDRIRGRSV